MEAIPDRPRAESSKPLLAVLPFAMRYRGRILAAGVFLLVAAAATLTLPAAVRQMIDAGFSPEQAAAIDRYFLFFFIVAAVMALAAGLRFYFVSWIGERVVADIRSAVYQRVIGMSPEFFEKTASGEVLSRIGTDTTLVQSVVGSSVSVALRSVVMLIGATVLLIVSSPKLAGMMGLVIPLVLFPIIIMGRWVRRLSRRSQDSIADFSALAGEKLAAIRTVQSFNQDGRESRAFTAQVEHAFKAAIRRISASAGLSITIVLLIFGSIVLVLWIGAKAVLAGTMTGGQLSQFILYAIIAASSAGALTEVWSDVQRAAGAMERLAELLNARPLIQAPEQPKRLPDSIEGRLRLVDVTFHYPARPDIPALDGLSLDITPGETIALVGPSGAGKSTIFQLLMRFYDPDSGQIQLEGVDLKALDPGKIRDHLAVVSQETVIFSGTVAENIAYGMPDASDDQIRAVARAAHAMEFVKQLPDGLNSDLGDRGVRLSGGQRQRIAIARALLRDPAILLLDEATSALDAESERHIQEAITEISRDRTTLIIAHRLATVRHADRIVVLDQGRVAAVGSHDELMASSDLYGRLAKLQFADALTT